MTDTIQMMKLDQIMITAQLDRAEFRTILTAGLIGAGFTDHPGIGYTASIQDADDGTVITTLVSLDDESEPDETYVTIRHLPDDGWRAEFTHQVNATLVGLTAMAATGAECFDVYGAVVIRP